MNENNIESIVVVSLGGKDQKPIGIITERGIVRTIGKLNPVDRRLLRYYAKQNVFITTDRRTLFLNRAKTSC